MRTLVLLSAIFTLSISSCSKREGCTDSDALNYDASAEKEGACRYTKAIFYAPSNRIGGTADRVEKIEIYLGPTPGQELIGTITTFDHPVPSACTSPDGAFEFELPGSKVEHIFITRYYYENGTNESGDTHLLKASNSKACHLVELTLYTGE